MQASPRLDDYRQRRLLLADYRGSLTAADGGEDAVFWPAWPPEQILLYDACWRALLRVQGPEARKWLNGMITANVRDLMPGQLAPSFQLDPKGHILAMMDVACLADQSFLLLTSEDQRADLLERLRRFIFISKLTVEDLSNGWSALCLRGPEYTRAWRAVQAALGLEPITPDSGACCSVDLGGGETGLAIATAPGGIPQIEFAAPAHALAPVWRRLEPLALAAGAAVYERDRILSRIPRHGVDITAAELPQETGQLDRLDFTKGCYVGQEIVERIRARGAVHRHWTSFSLDAAPIAGAAVSVEGQEVGRITSSAPRAGDWLGLGYIRDPHHLPGTPVRVGSVNGRVEA